MVNQQKGVHQETAYIYSGHPCHLVYKYKYKNQMKNSKNKCNKKQPSAVVVNDHMYPYINFV